MTSPTKRRDMDICKLMMSDHQVIMGDSDTGRDFFVKFDGPPDSFYEGGSWKVHVNLPENYPYKSPSIGFCNRIYHPNVDEASGSVCLDVINQTWSPMFDLVNIFGVFLPQLLLYPNPSDPLNGEAAALMMQSPEDYKKKVRDHVKQYATAKIVLDSDDESDDDDDDDDDDDEDCDDMSINDDDEQNVEEEEFSDMDDDTFDFDV